MVLTTTEVAKICGVAPQTVANWIDKGLLNGYKLPESKVRRISYQDLVQFLKARNSLNLLDNHKLNIIHVNEKRQCYSAGYLIQKYSHNLMIVSVDRAPIPPKLEYVDVILYGSLYTSGQMNELIKKNNWYGWYPVPFNLEKVVEQYRIEKKFVEKIYLDAFCDSNY